MFEMYYCTFTPTAFSFCTRKCSYCVNSLVKLKFWSKNIPIIAHWLMLKNKLIVTSFHPTNASVTFLDKEVTQRSGNCFIRTGCSERPVVQYLWSGLEPRCYCCVPGQDAQRQVANQSTATWCCSWVFVDCPQDRHLPWKPAPSHVIMTAYHYHPLCRWYHWYAV